jgi:DNA repair exonuclease SbcCD ATPase subunit
MRLLRVRVDDVRGIDSYEVAFATEGVTVIEAPNESGKSTLLDAVDLLLNEKDNAKKKAVRDLKPVGRDVGSRVEVELRCGPYHLTCTKRFNKQTATQLTVHAPAREQLSGTEAHDRLREILESEVDLDLFEALRFKQGRGLDGVALGSSNVIAARLDEAAGGRGDGGDDDLLARVRGEFERYHTPKGSEGKVIKDADAAVTAAEAHHAELAGRLAQLEEDVEELARLQRERAELERDHADLLEDLGEHRRRRSRVQQLRQQLAEARTGVERALREHADAQREADGRADVVAAIERAQRQRAELVDELAPIEQRVAELEGRLGGLDGDVSEAEATAQQAREAHDAARLAAELLRLREEHGRLTARQQRVEEVLADAREAASFLEGCRLTDDLLAEIRDAAERVRVAERTLEAGAPNVTITPHRPIEATIDGRPAALSPDLPERRSVEDALEVDLEGVARIEVTAGTSMGQLRASVEAARDQRDEACRRAGVADPVAAERLEEERREHRRTLRRRDADLERALEGVSREWLADRCQVLGDRLADLEARGAEPPLPTDLASAEDTLERTRARQQEAEATLARLRTERESFATQVEERRRAALTGQARRDQLEEELTRLGEQLADARRRDPDAQVTARVAEAVGHLEAARAEEGTLAVELEALEPDRVEMLATNAERRAEDLADRLARNAQLRSARQGRLDVVGEEGLGEQVAAAEGRLAHAEREQRRVRSRAAAARALHEELQGARDEAYRAYQRPLRELIARHGRVVFGEGLEVELDEELKVVRRTLDGDTLDWEHLSSGAKEQLAILSALAAARLAADGGVPLVLDDALGYTDPDRLAALGAVLGTADGAQIVVLTCVGERYRHVGGATTVRLRDARPADRVAARG